MQVYKHELVVKSEHLDELNHVNNVQYLNWVQDIARAHWQQNATAQLQANYFWVVLSHHIEYKASALLNDTLLIKTHVSESKGLTSIRHVDIYNKDSQKLIATCETKWCLMSKATSKPTRINQEIINLFL